ncbi:MAG TPA: HAD family hydrolase [Vicinamibacterales bacterium]|nr:HAD family hydrolase [Acidobacteriota bacterium]HOC16766.1 HAD family hydrolase [Vicinamibacterales bacterium]
MKQLQRIAGVLLDVDGTLVDSNDAHARAWERAFREHGYDVPFERIRPLIGMGGDKILPLVANLDPGSIDGELVADRRRAVFFRDHLPVLRAQRGARQLVQLLRERGLRLAVATSAKAEEIDGLLRAARVDDLVDEVVTNSHAGASKPEPDILQLALHRIRCAPAQAFMIGDTPYDIEAAGRSGIVTIALRCGGSSNQDLAGAFAVYNDPEALANDLDRVLAS